MWAGMLNVAYRDMFVRMFCHLGNMPHNMRPSQYVQKHNFPTHTHTRTHTLIHILSYTYLSQRRLELADDTAPVWATAAAAAASAGGAAERKRRGRQAAVKTERKIDFFYFSVNAISFGFVSVFVFVPFQDILDTWASASSPSPSCFPSPSSSLFPLVHLLFLLHSHRDCLAVVDAYLVRGRQAGSR